MSNPMRPRTDIGDMYEAIIEAIKGIGLFITSPLWIIPYAIWKYKTRDKYS